MKSAVETLSPTRVRLTVDVPFEELKPELDKAYREIAKQINIPGFRKGKVPPPVIDRQVGRSYVYSQALNAKLPQALMEAIAQNSIEALGDPDLDLKQGGEVGEDIKFTADVDVPPDFDLPEYEGLEVQVDGIEVSDDTVAEHLESLRKRFGTLRVVERPAADGDHVTIDLSASKNDEPVEGGQLSSHSYEVGSGGLVDGIDEAIRGKEAGEQSRFVTTLVGGDLAGEEVDVDLTVQTVKEQELPELDDDFAQLASEFDTLEELRVDLAEHVLRDARLEQARTARNAVLDKLLEAIEIPLPDGVIASEVESRKSSLKEQVRQIGLGWSDYLERAEQTEEELDAELESAARRGLKTQLVLDKVADAEEVAVGQEELGMQLQMMARQAGVDPQTYTSQVIGNGQVRMVVREVRRNKAFAEVIGKAVVTDASGAPVELNRLRPDGSLADPAEETAAEESAAEAAAAGATPGEVLGGTEPASAAVEEPVAVEESTESVESAQAQEAVDPDAGERGA